MSLASRIGIKWVVMALVAVLAVGFVALPGSGARAQPPNEMTVSGPAGLQGLGIPFNISVDVTDGSIAYDTYIYEVTWNPAIVQPTVIGVPVYSQADAAGAGYTLCAAPASFAGSVVGPGCGSATGPISYTGPLEQIELKCVAAGTSALTLTPFNAGPPNSGSVTYDTSGAPPNLPTALVAGSVNCAFEADLIPAKTATPNPVLAGGVLTYNVSVTNGGPNPAPKMIMADAVPPEKCVQGTPCYNGGTAVVAFPAGVTSTINAVADPFRCFWLETQPASPPFPVTPNVVLCDYSALLVPSAPPVVIMPGTVVAATILVDVPLSDAGKTNYNILVSGDLAGQAVPFPKWFDPDPADPSSAHPSAVCAGLLALGHLVATPANSLDCVATLVSPAVVTITKSGAPDPITAGSSITWTVTVHNAGPSPASAVLITDTVGTGQVAPLAAATITGGACTEAGGIPALAFPTATCHLVGTIASGSDVVITFQSPVDPNLATQLSCTNGAHVEWADPSTADTTGSVQCNPASTFLGLDKGVSAFRNPVVLTVGQSAMVNVTEQIEVQATGVKPITSHTWTANSSTGDGVSILWQGVTGDTVTPPTITAGNDVLTFDKDWDATPPGLYVISRNIAVQCTEPNAAGATIGLDLKFREKGNVIVTSPGSFVVYCVGAPTQVKSPDSAVLWIMRHPNCLNQVTGEYDVGPCASPPIGWLQINEIGTNVTDVDSPNDSDNLIEGLGAFEFQVKYDDKIFDLDIVAGPFLGSTGRTVDCSMSIVTENYVLFSCVSTGDPNSGPTSAGPVTLATINVYPKSDLYLRMRPTKDNGLTSNLLDENCEWADTYGTPLPGMVNGGHVPYCGNATITIRMLEGDINLDCNVDVLDDQNIAYRYGATFGLQLYNPFYDLEPKTTDYDIDIKDLQFVFGRNGSTCLNPIPDGQAALPPPPGPPLPPNQ